MTQFESSPIRPAPESSAAGGEVAGQIPEARAGSNAALGEILQACRKYLLLLANNALDSDIRPKTAASDLVQDTFAEAQRDFNRFQGSTEAELLAWLSKILANRVANNRRTFRGTHKRDVRREIPLNAEGESPPTEIAGSDDTPSKLTIAHDQERRLQLALARLPEPLSRVLALRTWEQKSFAEIGRRLNISAEAARKTWSRAIRRLQQELHEVP